MISIASLNDFDSKHENKINTNEVNNIETKNNNVDQNNNNNNDTNLNEEALNSNHNIIQKDVANISEIRVEEDRNKEENVFIVEKQIEPSRNKMDIESQEENNIAITNDVILNTTSIKDDKISGKDEIFKFDTSNNDISIDFHINKAKEDKRIVEISNINDVSKCNNVIINSNSINNKTVDEEHIKDINKNKSSSSNIINNSNLKNNIFSNNQQQSNQNTTSK